MSRKEYYYGIDLAKLMGAFLVVSIHTTLFMDVDQQVYTLYTDYVTRFAVPFFFISSGFFFAPLILCKEDRKEIRANAKRYFLRLLRPFAVWGICYFVLAIAEEVVIEKGPIKEVLPEKLHLLAVESPGGGLWYVYAVLWIVFLMFCFYKKNREFAFWGISFALFLLPGIWGFFEEQSGLIGWIQKAYYTVFTSERTFLFFGIYFFSGVLLFRFKPKKHPVWQFLLLQAALYGLFVGLHMLPKNIGTGILMQMGKYMISVVWFLIALQIPNERIPKGWLRDHARQMSTIIYFTHFLAIYLVKIAFMLLHIRFQEHCSLAYICCMIILIVYSVVLIKLDKNKKILKKLY
ncbi:MAG: acyltransferase [Ruminococcus sp.]|nr:acyltransferase [Ruminococcus sp.]